MSLERKIIIGLITSTEFIRQIRSCWDTNLLESQMARRLSEWCITYYDKYNKAPGQNIEAIYLEKLRHDLPKEIAEEIEQDILPGLSDEFTSEQFNLDYLLDQTHTYLSERHLQQHIEDINELIDKGDVLEAEKQAMDYHPVTKASKEDLDLGEPVILERLERAFATTSQPVVTYPGALGEFMNDQFVRGAFVAFMATEKRGKTYQMLDISARACRQGSKVAFFQAGDMTEAQMLKRIAVHLAQKSDIRKYSGEHWEPVQDCIFNQLNKCERVERECDFGVFEDKNEIFLRSEVTLKDITKAYNDNEDYCPCRNCEEYKNNRWGTVWTRKVNVGEPLTAEEAKKYYESFFLKNKRYFRLSTHVNDTLTPKGISTILDLWEKRDDFAPDLIVIDYADILAGDMKMEFRHLQNYIWKSLRGISEKRHCLVITATQADADSYERGLLKLKNFSEDKRKYAHVTALYGLNQDPKGREKELGIMRINELVKREGDFHYQNQVTVLQNLKRGRPYLRSYF